MALASPLLHSYAKTPPHLSATLLPHKLLFDLAKRRASKMCVQFRIKSVLVMYKNMRKKYFEGS
jgi:hypothetical protein